MNGCVGGEQPGEAAARRSITARARCPPATRNPSPRNRSPHTLVSPGTRNSASLALGPLRRRPPGLGARARPWPQGTRGAGLPEAPALRFFVSAWSPTVSRTATRLGGQSAARFWAAHGSPSLGPRCPQPVCLPARSSPPNLVPLGPRGPAKVGALNCVCGAGAGCGPRVSAFSPPPPLAALKADP